MNNLPDCVGCEQTTNHNQGTQPEHKETKMVINQPKILDRDGVVRFVNEEMGFAEDSHSRYVEVIGIDPRGTGPEPIYYVVLKHFNGSGRISYPVRSFPETLVSRTRESSDEENQRMEHNRRLNEMLRRF